jgi:hypothetical protein
MSFVTISSDSYKAALEVLAELPRWENCPYVVPNPKTMKPYGSIQRSWDIAR